MLRNCADPAARAQLVQGYDMLTNPEKMGDRFQFFSLLDRRRLTRPEQPDVEQKKPDVEKKKPPAPLPVAGFSELSFS